MKKYFSLFVILILLTITSGCNTENQLTASIDESSDYSASTNGKTDLHSELSQTADYQNTADILTDSEECIAMADEYAKAFQSLFLKYLQYETDELSIKLNKEPSACITDIFFYYPVVDGKIKCRDDLKSILIEYCTDAFSEKLLNGAYYRDFGNVLYKADSELGTAVKSSYGCYISSCLQEENKITVDFIHIGLENEYFDIDNEIYDRGPAHDTHFNMTLIRENEKWLISDCNDCEDIIGYTYRSDI